MGKNQQHKNMQRSKGGGEDGPPDGSEEPGADISFHTAEWHAARIAALTTERLSWEDWKKLQKENAAKVASVAAEEESQMKEYRAQLDADRNAKLAKGTNNAHLRIKKHKIEKDPKKSKSKKDKKDSKAKKRKKSKRQKGDSPSSSGSSSSSDSESRKHKKRRKPKELSRKHREDSSDDSKSGGEGPVRLSEFLKNG